MRLLYNRKNFHTSKKHRSEKSSLKMWDIEGKKTGIKKGVSCFMVVYVEKTGSILGVISKNMV